jgi:acyl-homoserine-lactone acylase
MRRLAPLAFTCLVLLGGCSRPSHDRSEPALAPTVEPASESDHWAQRAANITIIRDTWGIPHIYGKTDADAVFGMIYAQAEDDFPRIEANYLAALGMLAQVDGEAAIYRDLRARLFIRPDQLQQLYAESPAWLVELMDAWADGLNFYLHTHPETKPRLLERFEPWMALAFSEGSIGGDIERVELDELEQFYGSTPKPPPAPEPEPEPSGSNGFAIAPSKSATGNALLLINPHTSFYFRAELQVVSEQGLDVYGAATWGQFFVYQGFNEDAGWMHTSSGADAIDWYLETIVEQDGRLHARHGDQLEPLAVSTVTIPYAVSDSIATREFTVYHSQHGPIIREQQGKWVAIRLMQSPVDALSQSFLRTKARDHDQFRATMQLRTNSSNNTVFADSSGNIAYYHGNFVPRRDPQFDWSEPVDGSNPATDWQGLHELDELIAVHNPSIGWLQNTNNWPFTVAGPDSPKPADFPKYMAPEPENPRGIHALRLLQAAPPLTLDTLIATAYDPHLTAFETLLPALIEAHDKLPRRSPLRTELAEPIALLRAWDLRNGVDSTATSVAIYWAEQLRAQVQAATGLEGDPLLAAMIEQSTPASRLDALRTAISRLQTDFGDWRTPWGEINRYQRLDGQIEQPFSDDAPSVPVPFASGRWGALASYGATTKPGTKRMYGTSGNSFVAIVEFGERVRAKAITVGGQSGDPSSAHFSDQVQRYVEGALRDVWFYREDVEAHAERSYHPGESLTPARGR